MRFRLLVNFAMASALVICTATFGFGQTSSSLPKLADVVASGPDLWGEAAMKQPDGASFEFFRDLLPAPRYVHADFRYYPLVLSAPRASVKARLISNGSGVNLQGGSRSWKDVGTPVTFRVGPDEFRFGDLRERVSLPTLAEGYLPIVTIDYRHPFPVQSEGAVPLKQQPQTRTDEVYRLEAFASTDPAHAEFGVVWVRFSLAQGEKGIISIDVNSKQSLLFAKKNLSTEEGERLVHCDENWKWSRGMLAASLTKSDSAVIAIATRALPLEVEVKCNSEAYDEQRELARKTWNDILAGAMQVEVPEPLVQNAWRSLILQNFSLINKNRIYYSASNQYEQLYEAEGSDAALALLMWGYTSEVKALLPPLLDFKRAGLQSHINSLKVLDIISYYWLTRDADSIRGWQEKWLPALNALIAQREPGSGLLPKERYCGDISTPVYSLSVDAKAWRAIHDIAVVLEKLGDREASQRCSREAQEFGEILRGAVLRSARHETSPPFIPIALLDEEPIHSPITEVRIGSYWNIIMPYVIGSRLFKSGTAEEAWIPHYVEQHGGLCMGMTRSGGTAHGFWTGQHRVNPLYGNRYVTDVLRRDDVERALTSFYGMLAQGFTRNTFVVGEGCTLQPVDEGGRFFYCPPNSAGNGHFLTMLRNLLIQDWDANDDGTPDTLRLMHATPKRWLSHGQHIRIHAAPTAFGPVSCELKSEIQTGRVTADVTLPSDETRELPKRVALRVRVPEGFRVVSATIHEAVGRESTDVRTKLAVDSAGTVEIPTRRGPLKVEFKVIAL